jgi:hypothetical protein
MITTIILVTIALAIGYVLGRAQSVGRFHSENMVEWRERCIGMALLPDSKLLDLTAEITS